MSCSHRLAASLASVEPTVEIPEVDPKQAAGMLARGAVAVDVREPGEWQAGHIGQAVHMPIGELGHRYLELDSDAKLVLICRSGARSAKAAEALRGAGYDAHNLAGGMKAWVAAGQPIEPESGFVA